MEDNISLFEKELSIKNNKITEMENEIDSINGQYAELLQRIVELQKDNSLLISQVSQFNMMKEKLAQQNTIIQKQKQLIINKENKIKEYEEILGEKVEQLVVPVKPGRNTAMIIEVAAMNFRQKGMGYDAAQEFTKKLSDLIDRK